MSPTQHATLSASGSHRWLHCPPSALLEAAYRSEHGDDSSPAAAEGTAAHALSEWKIRTALEHLKADAGERPVSEWDSPEMEEHTDAYCQFVLERAKLALEHDPSALIAIEQRLDFSHLVPAGFGTADCLIIAGNRIEVIDFKYGQGVLVEVEHNPQAMLYGLGALNVFGQLYDIEEVTLTIHQPRRENISSWALSRAELEHWGETTVKPVAELAANGQGQFQAGTWCQFCRIAAICKKRAEANLALARHEFKPAVELTDEEISEVLTQIPLLTKWASDVEAYATGMAVNQGKQWPGFKVVEGRSIRKYADEVKVAHTLEAAGYTDIWTKKLATITSLEKLLGKKKFAELLGELVIKPAGKPALVPESDKRPALNIDSVNDEFTPIKEGK
ncbi:MAG: DUF2800 domain-containing protein [Arcanobacterium sp.]|uniref:DUF2800 domain-containing protein n=1 Tax=Trueperella pyogenes TaxID=1661 RepID=UPI002A9DB7EC|nr:DUF2800 domain-containing protein [Arcanobacterium sp.]MDY5854475.1 DUF2800 domain-containing protein [Arcanobacterium sp.]